MNKVYTYRYDASYDPAMPVVEIEIGRALNDASPTLTALVDSGDDATIILIAYLKQIQARRGRKKWMSGTAGGRMLVDIYSISFELGPFRQVHLEVVGGEQHEEILVGRDVIDHLSVTLNGPGGSVEIF